MAGLRANRQQLQRLCVGASVLLACDWVELEAAQHVCVVVVRVQVSPERRLQHQGGVAAGRVRQLLGGHRLEAVLEKLAGNQAQANDHQ